MNKSDRAWRRLGEALVFCLASLTSIVCFAQAPLATNQVSRPPAPRRPNIVLILADDLGYGDLGCYGQSRIKTPNIDKLAALGMRFTDFYAGSTVCAPSRCALMTGLNTGHCRIRGNSNVALKADDLTVAEMLKNSGYRTGLLGKWGLGNENTDGVPSKKGFEEFAGYLDQVHAHDYYTDYLWRYDFRTGFNTNQTLVENQGVEKRLYIPDLMTHAAINFMGINQPRQLNHYRPFFLYQAYTIPHANNELGARTGNGMQVPTDQPYSNEPWPQPEKNKAAMITRLDADVGRLMDKLEELKIDDNTLVIFTSDNGPHKEGGVDPKFFQSSGRLRGYKRDLYEGGIRVPFIAYWPGHVRSNQVNNTVLAFWDFLPTAAEIAQEKAPAGIDGISFLPALLGKKQQKQHEFLYWEFHERGFQQAVRMGSWKAIRQAPGKPLELYDLSGDPSETTNVADANPDIVAKIEAYLKKARSESPDFPIKAAPEEKKA